MNKAHHAALGAGLVLTAVTLIGSPARAIVPICALCNSPTVDYNISGLTYAVKNIVVFGEAGVINDNSISFAGQFSAPVGNSTISGLFGNGPVIVSTLMIGVTDAIPGQPGNHLVLFANNAFATSNIGKDFNTIYSTLLNYDLWYTDYNIAINDYSMGSSIAGESNPSNGETTLIADLLAGGGAGPFGDLDLGHFVGGQSVSVGSAGPGAMASAGFAAGDSFTAIAFSNGQIIGHGTSVVIPAASVPVPTGTWRVTDAPSWPEQLEPMPCSPRCPLCSGL